MSVCMCGGLVLYLVQTHPGGCYNPLVLPTLHELHCLDVITLNHLLLYSSQQMHGAPKSKATKAQAPTARIKRENKHEKRCADESLVA